MVGQLDHGLEDRAHGVASDLVRQRHGVPTTREVALTPPGTVFLDRCRVLVGAAESADAAAQAVAEGAAGQVRIGAVSSAFLDPLPAALRHFRQQGLRWRSA